METAIKAIISGVQKANETIRINGDKVWPTIDKIEFIEIYEDRALQALICLDLLKIQRDQNSFLNLNCKN